MRQENGGAAGKHSEKRMAGREAGARPAMGLADSEAGVCLTKAPAGSEAGAYPAMGLAGRTPEKRPAMSLPGRNVWLYPAVCLICLAACSFVWMAWCRHSAFTQLSRICELAVQSDPRAEQALLTALKQYQSGEAAAVKESPDAASSRDTFLARYGYEETAFPVQGQPVILLLTAGLALLGGLLLFLAPNGAKRQRQKRLEGLSAYLEQVNSGGEAAILPVGEDEFSPLEDEIYKTVTALRQTREAALAAKENYAVNLANIAHQLKTPIAAASVSLQLLLQREPSEKARQALRQMERLKELGEALLTLSRVDSGTLRLKHEPVDVYTALCLAADCLEELATERGVKILIPEGEAVEIQGDLEWTMQAFVNLLRNCVEHTPGGGSVHCEYGANPLYARIRIWDEGEGFAKEDIPHLFERFYQGRNASGNGTGIGLPLARSIFEMQNGIITAENRPDGGAGFEVRVYRHWEGGNV